MFNLILIQTITLAFRKGGGAFGALGFAMIIYTIFAFALSPEILHAQVLAVMCVSLMLSAMMGLPLIFERDAEDGMLEQYILKAPMLELVVFAKLLGYWCVQLLPILLMLPLLGLMAGLDTYHIFYVTFRMALLSPSLVSVMMLSAALTLSSKRGGLLSALISLPLLMPLVIFASSTSGLGSGLLLAAAGFALVPISCYVSAVIIRLV